MSNSTNLVQLVKAYSISYAGIPTLAWFSLVINFIETTLSGVFFFLSYYFVHSLNYDIESVSILISCYGVGTMFGGYLGGKLSDKYSANIVSAVSLIIQSIAFCFLNHASTMYLLIVVIFFLGISSYGFITSNYIWILSQCAENKAAKLRVLNILSVISNLALGLSAIIVTFISNENFPYFFVSNSFIFLILAFLLIFQEYQAPKKNIDNKKVLIENPNYSVKDYKILIIVLSSVFFGGVIVSQMSTTYSLYLESIFPEYGLIGFSIFFIINTLMIVTMQTPIGEFLVKKNALGMVGFGSLLLGLGTGLIAASYVFSIVIFACVIYTLGEMILFSIAQLVCFEKAPESKKGQQLGIFRMIFGASKVVGPMLGGMIYYHLGGNILWCLSCILGIFFFFICFYNKELC